MFESLPHGMSFSELDAARTPKVLRRVNAELVLDLLRASRPLRAADLAAETGLSRPTVNAVIDELVDLGWVLECSPDPADKPKRGRPGRRLAFNARRGYVLALDVGEIQVRAAVADLRGDIVTERVRRFNDTSRGGIHRLASTRRIAAATIDAAGIATGSLLATTIGISGGVDPVTGEILEAAAWFAIMARAGTPAEIVQKINAVANRYLQSDKAKELIVRASLEPVGGSPAEAEAFVERKLETWAPVIKAANISLN